MLKLKVNSSYTSNVNSFTLRRHDVDDYVQYEVAYVLSDGIMEMMQADSITIEIVDTESDQSVTIEDVDVRQHDHGLDYLIVFRSPPMNPIPFVDEKLVEEPTYTVLDG